MRVDIEEAPVDLAISRPAMDRGDRLLKRPIVEHGAVDKRYRRGIDACANMVGETIGDELGAARPAAMPFGATTSSISSDPRRRESARK